jgi:3-isopropylmalate/(R)-2-methylmalate dehydratase small subunit
MAKSHVYKRGHINTDEIIPARYLNMDDEKELARHCMEDLDKDFVKKVSKGDVIVAGEDFGCGSSREHAVRALRGAGVATVIAKTFARIFYRNAINSGFYLVESPDAVERIRDGDEVQIDYQAGIRPMAKGLSFGRCRNCYLVCLRLNSSVRRLSEGDRKLTCNM